MRVYTDEAYGLGSKLDLDILLPGGGAVRCWAEVVWVLEPPGGQPAKFDLGLKFTDMEPADIQRLSAVLARTD